MKHLRESGHYSYARIAAKLGVAKSTVQEAFGARYGRAGYTKPEPVTNATKGRSLAEFRQVYDKDLIVPQKIKAALKGLGGSWLYEQEFVKAAGVSTADLSNYRDQFADYVVNIRRSSKRAWAGSAALANQLREIAS